MNKTLIETIGRVLRTAKADGNLVGLFDKWNDPESTVTEDVIVEQLNVFERNFEESPTDTTDFIRIKDFTIQVRYIASIEPIDDYDGAKGVPLYKLLINRDERSKISFANTEVVFASSGERKREMQRVSNALRDFADVRFL